MDNSNNKRAFFKLINSRRKESSSPPYLLLNNIKIADPKEKAEAFSKTFEAAYTKHNPLSIPLIPMKCPLMPVIIINPDGILNILKNINVHKAMGPDEIHPFILKSCGPSIAPHLSSLIQKSFTLGIIPRDWKQANVIPVPKTGDKRNPDNFRPISLTSLPCKVAEHVLATSIFEHLDNFQLLTECQHGFRRDLSPETQLLNCVTRWAKCLDEGKEIDIIFLDYQKAFDSVCHDLLLSKLRSYGLPPNILCWIADFLSSRLQRVLYEGSSSEWAAVLSGVPQGSVLGPLLYLLYINDLPDCVTLAILRLFADDVVLSHVVCCLADQKDLQLDLDRVVTWSNTWKLNLKPSKCLHLRLTRKRSSLNSSYFIGATRVERVSSVKYLGVIISATLSWDLQVDNVTKKASRALGLVRRNLKGCSDFTKKIAYESLVRPILEFAPSVWDPHTAGQTHRLEMIQRRATRFVLRLPFDRGATSITSASSSLKWPTLANRRRQRRAILFHSLVHGKPGLSSLKTYLSFLPLPTRSSQPLRVNPIGARSNLWKFSFIPRTIWEWNALPPKVTSLKSTSSFKNFILNS